MSVKPGGGVVKAVAYLGATQRIGLGHSRLASCRLQRICCVPDFSVLPGNTLGRSQTGCDQDSKSREFTEFMALVTWKEEVIMSHGKFRGTWATCHE